jgi:YidC/Oxa1 family membrane protein insertase
VAVAEVFDGFLRGLGTLLSFFYSVVPSYGLAIILLTILVRLVLLPLTIKQTRSMQGMQRIQPKVKELQRKYKGNRQKLNEELMKLYKEHQVNPLGGCLPLLLQLPVFFALFSVLRAPIQTTAVPTETVAASAVEQEGTTCRPQGTGTTATVVCEGPGGSESFPISEWQDRETGEAIEGPQDYLFRCIPQIEEEEGRGRFVSGFTCESALGAKHLSRDSELFQAVVQDRANFLGMHLACSPTQAVSEEGIRQCSSNPETEAGGVALVGYFGMVALMVATTFYQQRQMQQASAGPQAQQLRLMSRIMPVFLGFISINISAGVLVYWVTTNAWQIGQQTLMLRSRVSEPPAGGDGRPAKTETTPPKGGGSVAKPTKTGQSGTPPTSSGSKKAGSRNARGRKKRSKR